ncbi:hypothetical protein HDU86_000028 [Geranomyces michiganensis]|nr:hypothetical protein HDU86_000028 [Geranomyces michiganensis]
MTTRNPPPLLPRDSGVDLNTKADCEKGDGANSCPSHQKANTEGSTSAAECEAGNIHAHEKTPSRSRSNEATVHPDSGPELATSEQGLSGGEAPLSRSSAKSISPVRPGGVTRPQTQAGATRVVTAMFSKSGLRFVEIPKDAGKPPLVPTKHKDKDKAHASSGTSSESKAQLIEVHTQKPVLRPEVPDNLDAGDDSHKCLEEATTRTDLPETNLAESTYASADEPHTEGDPMEEAEDGENRQDEAALSSDGETEDAQTADELPGVPKLLSCILDHDFSAGDLSGWSAEGDGELTAFHLVRRELVPEQLPPAPRVGASTPESSAPRWRGANHATPKVSTLTQGSHGQPLLYHPLAKGGYTTTSSWKYRKGSGEGIGSGADVDIPLKAGVRISNGEPPTYRDGYLIDANLPLRYNFIHPPLPAGVGALPGTPPASEDKSQSGAAPEDRPKSSPPHNGSSVSLGAVPSGLSTAHAFPFAEETVERISEPLSHASQGSNRSDSSSSTDQAATQWRHQRVKAAMTMKELKKVFPPLMKQYLGKGVGSSSRKAILEAHQYPPHKDGTGTVSDRPISRKGPPQKLKLRQGGSKVTLEII